MATDGTGYLIPDNPQPDELNCLLVFYPDDPMYLAALLGSITYLGTWTAWERDPDKRARLAAAAWKLANECTLDSMGCLTDLVNALAGINATLAGIQQAIENQSITVDAGDIVTAVNGVTEAISNLEFDSVMSEGEMVTVNNYCGCGCGGGSGSVSPLPEDFPIDYIPPTPLPPNEEDPQGMEVNENSCAYAQYLLTKWRSTVIGATSGDITLANIIARFQQTFSDTSAITNWQIDEWADLIVYLGVYMSGLLGYGSSAAAEIDNKFEAIKCAMLQAVSQSTIQGNVDVLIDTMSLPLVVRLFAKATFKLLPTDAFSSGIAAANTWPQWAYAAGCPPCVDGGDIDLPIDLTGLPAEYVVVPVTVDTLYPDQVFGGHMDIEVGDGGLVTLHIPAQDGVSGDVHLAFDMESMRPDGWISDAAVMFATKPEAVNSGFEYVRWYSGAAYVTTVNNFMPAYQARALVRSGNAALSSWMLGRGISNQPLLEPPDSKVVGKPNGFNEAAHSVYVMFVYKVA